MRGVRAGGLPFGACILAGLLACGSAGASPDEALIAAIPPVASDDIRSTAVVLLPAAAAAGAEPWASRLDWLGRANALVVQVDATRLLGGSDGTCAGAAAALLTLAATAQDRAGAPRKGPVVIGTDAATAALAFGLASAAPQAVEGIVTPDMAISAVPCAGIAPPDPETKTVMPWHVAAAADTAPPPPQAGARVYPYATGDDSDSFRQAYLDLAGSDPDFDASKGLAGVEDLPLTLIPAAPGSSGSLNAIFLSGDGGWAGFDAQVSRRLSDAGIPVSGVSVLKYLWSEKSPEEIAADLTRLDRQFAAATGRDRLLLIGFSMGASVLPFVLPHLDAGLRARLAGLVLLGPEKVTGFEIVPAGWFGAATGEADVVAALAALPAVLPAERVLCVSGADDQDSACPVASLPGMQRAELSGGHHMDNAYDAVATAIEGLLAGR